MKLKRATYRHIEAEIYAYRDTLRAMNELRQDIIHKGREEDSVAVGGGGYIQSSVERRATTLADSILLGEMSRITTAIRETFDKAKEEGRRIVYVKYGLAIDWQPPFELSEKMKWKNRFDMSVDDMSIMLPVDESTFHRHRTGFVYGVAERLGWW